MTTSRTIISAPVEGEIFVCEDGLSFWGGVDPATSQIQDVLHPQLGETLAGRIVMMPSSRGSCSGGGILLGLALSGLAPAALVFNKAESVLTLGALVADQMFGHKIAIMQLSDDDYFAMAGQSSAMIESSKIVAGSIEVSLTQPMVLPLELTPSDQAMLAGNEGEAAQLAMELIVAMARLQGAQSLIDISQVHIDGCIYSDPAYLSFAQRMENLGAKVCVPTTLNAISVDYTNWKSQGVDEAFGSAASKLAESYVAMGAQPSFTCAPYLLDSRPKLGETIAWSESNAVIYANSIIGAHTAKHPDFIDLCIAITGRAPNVGVYLPASRKASCVVHVSQPDDADDAFWPMFGWLLGEAVPDQIPLVHGLEHSSPTDDDLKALCAAFGTTSASPLLHVAGVTPEGRESPVPDAAQLKIKAADFARVWRQFNGGAEPVDLVALGSPHFSASECRAFLQALHGRKVHANVSTLITLGRATLDNIQKDGTETGLRAAGVTLVCDLCWCSITEPVFPSSAQVVMTNSGKYAHYGPGLSGRKVRLGSLADCADCAVTGQSPQRLPAWIGSQLAGKVG